MAERKKKTSNTQTERTVKTSLTLGADLHVKLQASAAMRGMPSNAIVVEVLTAALSSIIVFDRSKRATSPAIPELPQS